MFCIVFFILIFLSAPASFFSFESYLFVNHTCEFFICESLLFMIHTCLQITLVRESHLFVNHICLFTLVCEKHLFVNLLKVNCTCLWITLACESLICESLLFMNHTCLWITLVCESHLFVNRSCVSPCPSSLLLWLRESSSCLFRVLLMWSVTLWHSFCSVLVFDY